jgi:DNA-directed RNA polymerase II subunit RPB3
MAAPRVFQYLAYVTDDNKEKQDTHTLTFRLSPTDTAYANALRRTVLIGTESIAFRSDMNVQGKTTDVDVEINTTPMTNEMLADRMGLLPINVPDPTTWNSAKYRFELDVTNKEPTNRNVKAEDIEVFEEGAPGDPWTRIEGKRFFPANPLTNDTALITVLKGVQSTDEKPQQIKLTAVATKGTGREHIRFSPVCQCSYSNTIDTNEARQKAMFEKWLSTTKNIHDLKALESEPERLKAFEREFQTMEIQRCFVVNEKGDPYSFDFVVESIGVQPVVDIVERALVNLQQKCQTYTALAKSEMRTVKIRNADAQLVGYDVYFQHEDHTLGNMFQTWILENLFESGEVTFAGYKVPHPLRDEMVLRIGVKDGNETTVKLVVAKAAEGCAALFGAWLEDWRRAKSQPIGKRTRASLRLTAANAKAVEQAISAMPKEPEATAVGPAPTGPPKRRAFYEKKFKELAP